MLLRRLQPGEAYNDFCKVLISITTLRKYCHKYGATQIATLARTYAHRMRLHPLVARLAASIVKTIAVASKNDGVKRRAK